MYQVTRKSFKGDMLQLTDDSQKNEWYFIEDKCQPFAKDIKVGDSISIRHDTIQQDGKSKKRITFLTKEKDGGGTAEAAIPGAGAPVQKKAEFKPYGQKSKRESEKISRLSVLSSTSNIVSALIEKEALPLDDLAELFNATDELFTKLMDRVNLNLPEDSE